MKNRAQTLVLASGSPRRREFFESLDIGFKIFVPDVIEKHQKGETPEEYVSRNALIKARGACQQMKTSDDAVFVGCDTIVVSPKGEILEKPSGEEDAQRMIRELSGNTHCVMSSFVCWGRAEDGILAQQTVKTDVVFKKLCEEEILWYCSSDEPFDKAGGYAIQGKASVFIESISGSYSNVVGLPLCELVLCLQKIGFVVPAKG